MALKHKDEYYTMFTFHEDGRSFNRRIHAIDVQDACGAVVRLEGKHLPESFTFWTKRPMKGRHPAQVLLRPESKPPYVAPSPPQPYLQLRDLFNMVLGIVIFTLGCWFVSVIQSCL